MLPLVFKPYLRPQLWGGRALGERFGKTLPNADERYGESWEVSALTPHPTSIREGEFAGTTLPDLFAERQDELFGAGRFERFPLLVKLLDCQEKLSVQVHPDDFTAFDLLGEPNGKTEAWVVLEAGPDSRVYAGFKTGVDEDEVKRRLADGSIEECVHSFQPSVGDCVFIPAGLVHAVGGGVVLAEVQQSSDATFRLFDWNRIEPTTGLPRKLHLEHALRSIHFDLAPGKPVTATPRESLPPGIRAEHLVKCPYFRLDRFEFSADALVPSYLPLPGGEGAIWMTLDGEAVLEGAHYRRRFGKGETVLVPAACEPLTWRTAAQHDGGAPINATLLRIESPG